MINFIKTHRTLLFHSFAWTFIIFLNVFDIENLTIRREILAFQIPMWICYILLFYLNYLVLIPVFLFKKRVALYTFSLFIVLTAVFFAMRVSSQLIRLEELDSAIEKIEAGIPLHKSGLKMKALGPHPSIDRVYELRASALSASQFNPLLHRNLVMIYGLLFVITVSLVLHFTERWKNEEQRLATLEKEHVKSELEYLKQQINPHFLFNALNSIYSLTLPCSQVASDSVLKLSSILRYMLYSTGNKEMSLKDEIKIIEDYIGLQKLRLTQRTKVTFNCNGNFGTIAIEPLILIPIVENAFKYGVDSSKDSFVDINVEIQDKKLIFETLNTVVTDIRSKDSGIGLKNIKRRLMLIYPNAHSLTSRPEEGGLYRVRLTINFDKK